MRDYQEGKAGPGDRSLNGLIRSHACSAPGNMRLRLATAMTGPTSEGIPPVFSILQTITDFGDPGVLLPFSIAVATLLAIRGQAVTAARLMVAIVACCGLAVSAKVACVTLAGRLPIPAQSPSGHAALSAAVYGSVALVFARTLNRSGRLAVLAAAGGLTAAVAVSRLLLHKHSP